MNKLITVSVIILISLSNFATKGNPYLKPSYSNNLELTYSKSFKSNYLTPKLYFKYYTDEIYMNNNIREDETMISVPENIGQSTEYGIGFTGVFNIVKWLSIRSYFDVFKKDIYENNTNMSEINIQRISARGNGQLIINPYKDWNLMTIVQYTVPTISCQTTQYRDVLILFGLEKSLFRNAKFLILYMPPILDDFTFNKTVSKNDDL